jgi:hypothetical protein
MKQMIRNGWNGTEIWWISKMRWNKWLEMVKRQGKWMNKQIEMKQMIRNGWSGTEIWLISKLRWRNSLDMVDKTGKMNE